MAGIKIGDYVQYFTSVGNIVGYGLVTGHNGFWCTVLDHHTGEIEHWNPNLMKKIVI
tara:strand:+ start:2702 stop:2872 length:171 start_codon:yes stop_codon:yes gene_type:complete